MNLFAAAIDCLYSIYKNLNPFHKGAFRPLPPMSSLSSDVSGLADISFRKESICEEPTPVDTEVSDIIALHRSNEPNCTRSDEIMAAIAHCKNRLKERMSERNSPVKQMYLDKIVQLSLEKQKLEENGDDNEDAVVKALGHEFYLQRSHGRRNPYCEVCMGTIWRVVQSWRRCKLCGIRVHDKCSTEVRRVCAGVAVSRRDFRLATAMCEERGLCAQNYACAECEAPLAYVSESDWKLVSLLIKLLLPSSITSLLLSFEEGHVSQQPRLCEYTGLLFCSNCHWGDQWSIPARIIHNMDARPRPVCRAAKQLLAIVDNRPLIDLSEMSPSLIKYHKELKRVQQLRRNFLLMKCYFISCRNAAKLRILQYLNRHQHFVEGADMYSIADLRELCTGNLLRDLEDIHTVFRRHIEEECEICAGNGFYCEMCDDADKRDEVIFPFSENVAMCQKCLAVFHAKCFEKRSSNCSRCERRQRRNSQRVSTEDDSC
ncbi:hypothetical protein Y032_0588g356 [Ancylostoma ceylanicum]|uniref:Phorbol-ester/DAG-type domain-containing protein n=1 Tax=Ancylostoma ceylanicum TaxID=53326 RepID=A0A016WMR6_9BILA|nr:hypothetical protein Y032_0588g356 [Ancylostoma ceylanicum]